MLTNKSIEMLKTSFEKTKYKFSVLPEKHAEGKFGIYVNTPFCETKCGFCPFYKEIYDEELKRQHIQAIITEINNTNIKGTPTWIYFGGGTPNLLTIEELRSIVEALRSKVFINSMGIEVQPKINLEYLRNLKDLGFTKISFGIESLSSAINEMSNRDNGNSNHIFSIIEEALALGFWVNTDLIVGLKNQTQASFMEDVKALNKLGVNQITTYPHMNIRGLLGYSYMPDNEKYLAIEEAADSLFENGYKRQSIWCFTNGDDVYDSSQDELSDDYIGFGAASFSAFGKYKTVNPCVSLYVKNIDCPIGFVSPKSAISDKWRAFAKMIYTLKCETSKDFPWYINLYTLILSLSKIGDKKGLSSKGINFAHKLTKTVVESLPFPLQNKASVLNYDEYEEAKKITEEEASTKRVVKTV